jgi:hypothetical protein
VRKYTSRPPASQGLVSKESAVAVRTGRLTFIAHYSLASARQLGDNSLKKSFAMHKDKTCCLIVAIQRTLS